MLTQDSKYEFHLHGRGDPGTVAELPVCCSVRLSRILQLCGLPDSRDPGLLCQRCLSRLRDQSGISGRDLRVRLALNVQLFMNSCSHFKQRQ